jgi:hypothetical protein
MYTDEPDKERAEAVNTLEAIRLLKAEPKEVPQKLQVAADVCSKAANELIAAIDAYGKICQATERQALSIELVMKGAEAGQIYEAKRDAFFAAKLKFILSVE